jgi:ADP-sugar diphosphatase
VQAADRFGGGRLGFVKLAADVRNARDQTLPGAVFLRGPSVAMLVLLVPDDAAPGSAAEAAERRVVLTVQPRVPAGSLAFVELPAGMVDGGSFAGTAAREMREELDLVLPEDQLVCLSDLAAESCRSIQENGGEDRGEDGQGQQQQKFEEEEDLPNAMFPSAGGCDEFIPIFMHERRVPRSQLKEWAGKLTGLRDQGEHITLKLVRMNDLWKEGGRDSKCLAALALWEGLKREGKL